MDYEPIIREAAARAATVVRSEITLLKLSDAKQDVEIKALGETMDELKQTVKEMADGNRKIMAFGIVIFLVLQSVQVIWSFFKG